ncbi:DUF4157 domain-containing protein [Nostoc sp. UHCC 0302]|uniref:eCIS core domain-containing protein n=1 Tax=Nostoc sp. UHCC 0302 TaxID=3134896 RepID=UPI00311C9D3E
MNKRSHIHKKADSSASNPVLSQLQSRPKIPQAQLQSSKHLTQTETEDQEFQQQKFEATKLESQAKYGTITPEGQERLTVLQAKMSGLLQRRLEHASSFGHNFANIPISRPDAASQPVVQTKLTIGEPGDKYEQEADRVAAQVVNQINAPVFQQAGQSQPIHREKLQEEEKELQMKPMLQLRSGKVGMAAAPDVEASIQQARGGGQPLADSIREPMEQAFGADFSRVKIHTDSRADQLNQSIQAKAFTTRQDIFFRQGVYEPGSRGGQELLAHELTHVVQQNEGTVQQLPIVPKQSINLKQSQQKNKSGGRNNQNVGVETFSSMSIDGVEAYYNSVAHPKDIQPKMLPDINIHWLGCHEPVEHTTFDGYVIQRVNIGFTNIAEKYQEKADQIIAVLRNHATIVNFIGNRPCYITLKKQEVPADITADPKAVRINLAIWYFEQMSLARIMGMLNHEFGIHPVAEEGDTSDEQGMEALPLPTNVQVNTGGYFSKKNLEVHTVTPNAAKQADHIFGALPFFNRYTTYRTVVVEMLDALNSVIENEKNNSTELTTLLDTYLMDIASILAGNDDRKAAATKPGLVADLYNLHLGYLEPNVPDKYKKYIPQEKSSLSVVSDYASLITSMKLSKSGGSVRNDYQPGAEQTEYLENRNLEVDWVEPTGLCIFDAIGRIIGTSGESVKLNTLLKLKNGDENTLQVVQNAGQDFMDVIVCITENDWANPNVGDIILEVASVANNVGLDILMPGAWIYSINGGGNLVVKVLHPLEHYHATKAKGNGA